MCSYFPLLPLKCEATRLVLMFCSPLICLCVRTDVEHHEVHDEILVDENKEVNSHCHMY
jgi:hypothetical protein